MPKYYIKTVVEYWTEEEFDNEEQAEQYGWQYEDYKYSAEVDSIEVKELEDDEDEEEE